MLVAGSSLTSKVKELQQDAFPTSSIYAKRQSVREPNQSVREPNQSVRDLQRFERNYLA
jgi:hypothetical protein